MESAATISAEDAANTEAVTRMVAAQPVWIGVSLAGAVIPEFEGQALLHSGPPIDYRAMCPPMRTAAQGAAVYERWAPDVDAADRLLSSGEVALSPCHEHGAVGTMTGIITPGMPVFVVEDEDGGGRGFGRVTEGQGQGLRFGGSSPEVIARLQWVRDVLAPALGAALAELPEGRMALRPLFVESLAMGDELHMRNAASTAQLVKRLASPLARALAGQESLTQVLSFLTEANDQFFLDLILAGAKVIADAARGVAGSSVVVAMARNGVEVGVQVAGLADRWFTGPASVAEGRIFPGYTIDDANPDLGDSAITEIVGLGNMAMAGAAGIVRFLGRTNYAEAAEFTTAAYAITVGTDPSLPLPVLDFQGVPLGIDARKVVMSGYAPRIDTAIAPRDPALGSIIGAGISTPPLEPFAAAVAALDRT